LSLSYRRFILLYHTTNHCSNVSFAHEIIIVVCCSISLSLIDLWSTTANVNETERERLREKKKGKKGVLLLLYIIDAWLAVTVVFSLFSPSLVFCFCCSGIGRPPPDCSRPLFLSLLLFFFSLSIASSNNCSWKGRRETVAIYLFSLARGCLHLSFLFLHCCKCSSSARAKTIDRDRDGQRIEKETMAKQQNVSLIDIVGMSDVMGRPRYRSNIGRFLLRWILDMSTDTYIYRMARKTWRWRSIRHIVWTNKPVNLFSQLNELTQNIWHVKIIYLTEDVFFLQKKNE
jgi:hypothetical protein